MKLLKMYFFNEDGQPTSIIPRIEHKNLTAEQVRLFMEQLIELELFYHKGQQKFATIDKAKYVDTKVTHLF
ncbi:DUF2922 domain-containing protein [Vagococcus sp. BWB3-3]|uniref:DUF2922 domain-containing protein n=1 Tax=Vagococcus allomyrinae TaxID=2794353 RepID=A0A940P6R3_9ENTE|nr:DUF2922 domain-containing protein [Vagococcus allomyrinae]MBP1042442.1 DUF2922 domain-containing protein [Vagococcus allomyrinae]